MERHYGLDWLRIGAFGLLILYHVGMVFVPWGFHVKLPGDFLLTLPMLAVNPWRLSLLFVVSGYASRALLMRSEGLGAFARDRSVRLLAPLLFGMLVVVPPQPWVELVTKHGYGQGLAAFWAGDYLGFRPLHGLDLPTWNHLWFVVYLWVYTLALAFALALTPASALAAVGRALAWAFRGPAILLLPMAYLILVDVVLFPGGRETHALVDDPVAHASYLPAFLLGFALGRAPHVLRWLGRRWLPCAVVAVAAYAVVAALQLRFAQAVGFPSPWGHVFSAARAVQGAASVAALLGAADRFWNRDHPRRAILTEAVFPFYLVHQTVIVLVAYWIMPAGLPWPAAMAVLVVATVAGCWTFYLAGRAIGPLRPLIGLKRRARPSAAPLAPAAA
ncbi:MAG TPA: acyltransferase [Sphingomonas sp.]|jgi:peptidoglycan/LPS O-acetylase OafA/YrhL